MKNIDRWLGVLCALFVFAITVVVFANRNLSASWGIACFLTIGLTFWVLSGLKRIEIGWKGQLLFLGERSKYFFGEGWRWVPFPFGVKTTDCRQTVKSLDPLKVITRDNVQVEIKGSIIRQTEDLDKYFGTEESGINQGLDDIWDATIRANVKETDLDNVLKMHVELGQQVHDAIGILASQNWGIKIIRVVIAGIEPDVEVTKDLALKERENLQREGQVVEANHIIALVNLFKRSKTEGGAKMSHGEAVEMAQVITGKATSKKITGFTFSPEILLAVAKILGKDNK